MKTYVLQQEFRYEYPGPICDLRHRFVVAPPPLHGDQRRLRHALDVQGAPEPRWETDAFGNHTAWVEAPRLDRPLIVRYEAVVERLLPRPAVLEADAVADPRYRELSTLTAADSALQTAAAQLLGDEAPLVVAERINRFVHNEMRYRPDTTCVRTTAAQAFAQRSGVCQDYAHVMLALCRLCGIPARYVSGHLLGEGGTHAWVEVLDVADATAAIAVPFDPTHDRRCHDDYVFVAAGSDYFDVAPTSGSFTAPYAGRLTATRSLMPRDASSAA